MADIFAFPGEFERQFLPRSASEVPEESRQKPPLQRPPDLMNQDMGARLVLLENRIKVLESHITFSSIFILSLGSVVWKLRKPLAVTMEQRSANEFIACIYDVDLYGYGETAPEALDDLKEAIVNQMDDLVEDEEMLSSGLRQQLNFLKEYVSREDV